MSARLPRTLGYRRSARAIREFSGATPQKKTKESRGFDVNRKPRRTQSKRRCIPISLHALRLKTVLTRSRAALYPAPLIYYFSRVLLTWFNCTWRSLFSKAPRRGVHRVCTRSRTLYKCVRARLQRECFWWLFFFSFYSKFPRIFTGAHRVSGDSRLTRLTRLSVHRARGVIGKHCNLAPLSWGWCGEPRVQRKIGCCVPPIWNATEIRRIDTCAIIYIFRAIAHAVGILCPRDIYTLYEKNSRFVRKATKPPASHITSINARYVSINERKFQATTRKNQFDRLL